MQVSPPLAILILLAVGVTGVTWIAPAGPTTLRVTVSLPAETHGRLALSARHNVDAAGNRLTVESAIEVLARRLP